MTHCSMQPWILNFQFMFLELIFFLLEGILLFSSSTKALQLTFGLHCIYDFTCLISHIKNIQFENVTLILTLRFYSTSSGVYRYSFIHWACSLILLLFMDRFQICGCKTNCNLLRMCFYYKIPIKWLLLSKLSFALMQI